MVIELWPAPLQQPAWKPDHSLCGSQLKIARTWSMMVSSPNFCPYFQLRKPNMPPNQSHMMSCSRQLSCATPTIWIKVYLKLPFCFLCLFCFSLHYKALLLPVCQMQVIVLVLCYSKLWIHSFCLFLFGWPSFISTNAKPIILQKRRQYHGYELAPQ